MPATPKLGDGCGLVGAVEVLWELESEQEGYAYRHVGVAREVAVDLEGVAIDGKEILKSAVEVRLVEDTLHEVDGDIVGDDGFLEKSGHDEEDACAEHLTGDEEGTANLRNEVTRTDDRTCHKLREEADVEGVVEQAVEGTYRATIDVDGVAKRLEREEGDADGQEDVAGLPHDGLQIGATDDGGHIDAPVGEQSAEGLAEEVGVFEEEEQPEVEEEGEEDKGLAEQAVALFQSPDGTGYAVVAHGDKCQEPKKETAGLIIEVVGEQRDEEDTHGVCLAQLVVDEREA